MKVTDWFAWILHRHGIDAVVNEREPWCTMSRNLAHSPDVPRLTGAHCVIFCSIPSPATRLSGGTGLSRRPRDLTGAGN
ncbi:hypothetical protein [Micromonospora sp. KC606]|uniref:hypothetical protein n=1 Tax=Micromonospora sp. KC606 TaxID=2530379 RepID=UPI001FB6D7E8|nr:hypothetical protein [Micromonospora sp. KC606]